LTAPGYSAYNKGLSTDKGNGNGNGGESFFDQLDLGREPSLAVHPPQPTATTTVSTSHMGGVPAAMPAAAYSVGTAANARASLGGAAHAVAPQQPASGAHSWQGWQAQEQPQPSQPPQQQTNVWAGECWAWTFAN
jgi:hypothetical protein